MALPDYALGPVDNQPLKIYIGIVMHQQPKFAQTDETSMHGQMRLKMKALCEVHREVLFTSQLTAAL